MSRLLNLRCTNLDNLAKYIQLDFDKELTTDQTQKDKYLPKTNNRLMVTIHSKDVTEILPLYRMTKFDLPPHFLKGLMHSFPMMYNTI